MTQTRTRTWFRCTEPGCPAPLPILDWTRTAHRQRLHDSGRPHFEVTPLINFEEIHRTALEDVEVLPVELRRFADPLTWAWDGDTESVGIMCEGCVDVFEVSGLDRPEEILDGIDCPNCGHAWGTERVILAWTPRAWDRPIVRP